MAGFALTAVAFFLVFFLYVALRIEPALEFEHDSPIFRLTPSFLAESLRHPGGPVNYVAAFVAQGSRFNFLGALIFTLFGVVAFEATRRVLHRMSGALPRLTAFVPLFLLLGLRERLGSPSLGISIGWLLAVGCAALPAGRAWWRLTACWMLSVLVLCAAGPWPCVLFAVLAATTEALRSKRRWLALGCLLSVSIVLVGMLCFPDIDWARTFHPWGRGPVPPVAGALWLSVPLSAVMLALLPSPAASTDVSRSFRRKASSGGAGRWRFQNPVVRRGFAAGFFVVGWAWVWIGFDAAGQSLRKIEYYSARHDDARVLAAARKFPDLTGAAEVRLHLALYRTGRLLEDLFSFPNQRGRDLLPSLSRGIEPCRPQSEVLLELGQVNSAEHFAHESLEHEGDRPDTLRLLARINILKNRPQAARVFLNVLRQMPFQREWAATCLRQLAANPRLPENADLARIRSLMVTRDTPHQGMPVEMLLEQSLYDCPKNRMAFEYLMAHYLLTRKMDKLVRELRRLDDFNYAGIPRHCEEAILLYEQLNTGTAVNLHGRQIRRETLQRFQQFLRALRLQPPDSPTASGTLAPDFGDTYWFYYYFGRPHAGDDSAEPISTSQ